MPRRVKHNIAPEDSHSASLQHDHSAKVLSFILSDLCENDRRKESQSTQKHALATHRSHAEVGQSHGGLKKGDPTERQGVLGSLFAASSNWGGVRLSNKVLPLFGKKSTRLNLVITSKLINN